MSAATVVINSRPIQIPLLEAPRIIEELTAALQEVEVMIMRDLKQPEITSDGYLTYEAVHDFFAQVNSDPIWLNTHASRLYGQIVKLSRMGRLNVLVVCRICGHNVVETCDKRRRSHSRDYPSLRLHVDSLKQEASKFLGGDFLMVGQVMQQDFRILMNCLPKD